MNCARLRQMLDAWLDGELDAATSAEIEGHVHTCAACTALRDGRVALGEQLPAQLPYHRAPAELRARVLRSLETVDGSRPLRRGPTWSQAGAVAAVVALLSMFLGYWIAQPIPERSLPDQVVASHVASLAPSRRLTEVASADRHAVKPWFQGKVDFAPVVKDLSGEGYVLLGGRLDHVGDGQAVAIVYGVREHVINLFAWRAGTAEETPLLAATARGFNLATWSEPGLRFAAVSDVDAAEIERFARLVRGRSGGR